MSRPERRRPRIAIRQALALGLLHGPAELLPISSSGHIGAVPWLLGWSYSELDGEQRKSFEVALHGGTAAALLIGRRARLSRMLDGRTPALVAVASAPAAATGYKLEATIEQRLGTPATIATGLLAGSAAMVIADRSPQTRRLEQAGWTDAIWVGVSQATALVPGVSRLGATLAAARLRGFARADAQRLSELVALPPIAGASGLRLLRHRQPVDVSLAAGAAAAFASTLVCERAIRRLASAPLWPFAAYRVALATTIVVRLRRGSRARRRPPRARP